MIGPAAFAEAAEDRGRKTVTRHRVIDARPRSRPCADRSDDQDCDDRADQIPARNAEEPLGGLSTHGNRRAEQDSAGSA